MGVSVSVRRLGFDCLGDLPAGVGPSIDARGLGVGIVHLGLGAFHRAHQAVYTDAAIAAAGGQWGICGVTQRSDTVARQLRPQDGLYSVISREGEQASVLVVGSMREVLCAPQAPGEVADRIARTATKVVTLTVTEKGYRLNPVDGRLRVDDPDVVADAAGRPPVTVVGRLVAGLAERRRRDGGPLTVVCCDNLTRNGTRVASMVADFCELLPPGQRDLAAWIDNQVRFPSTMVDRIVPATTPADLAEARRLLGVEDRGAVVAEAFSQWVIEDDFLAGRPAWERAGATMTGDAEPWEMVKLRVLNATHSGLAYLGALGGYQLIADAARDERLEELSRRFITEDVTPALTPPEGFDLDAYTDSVLLRFSNRALGHRCDQVAMDGSQKLGTRLLPTITAGLSRGERPRWATLILAAWMQCMAERRDDTGAPLRIDDPLAETIAARLAGADGARTVAERLLTLPELFPPELAANRALLDLVTGHLSSLRAHGALPTIEGLLRS